MIKERSLVLIMACFRLSNEGIKSFSIILPLPKLHTEKYVRINNLLACCLSKKCLSSDTFGHNCHCSKK